MDWYAHPLAPLGMLLVGELLCFRSKLGVPYWLPGHTGVKKPQESFVTLQGLTHLAWDQCLYFDSKSVLWFHDWDLSW